MNNNIINDLEELRNDTGWLIGSENIANALDVAMKRVKDWDLLKLKITEAKQTASRSPNRDYKTGYICAMSYIEGCMAEMENEDEC